MDFVRLFATVGLFLIALSLGFELRLAEIERTTSRAEVAARKRQHSALQAEIKARSDRALAAAPAPRPVPATPLPPDPRIANRTREMARRNALNTYVRGFDRLQLPTDILAQAKAIILARSESAAEAQKRFRSMAELLEENNRLKQRMEEQLTALLGAEATLELKSAAREEALDWTIGTDLWDAGTPLTPVQLRALARAEVQLDSQATHWALPERGSEVPDPQTGLTRRDTNFLAATSEFLSDEQQAALRRSLVEDQQYHAAMRSFAEKQKQLSGSR
jgi:hypothetical protein